jgi:hypothetical protein
MKSVPLKRKTSLKRVPMKRKPVMEKPKKRVLGEKSLSKLKKEYDRLFSIYIRAKYEKTCYTCGKTGMLQNGHFIVRKYLATRWEEDNCRPQCVGCNIYGKGMFVDFEERLVKELGAARVQEMKDSRRQVLIPTREWYLEKIDHYKNLVNKP